jgi:hypothetical protein
MCRTGTAIVSGNIGSVTLTCDGIGDIYLAGESLMLGPFPAHWQMHALSLRPLASPRKVTCSDSADPERQGLLRRGNEDGAS